jgi:hypothetical protein
MSNASVPLIHEVQIIDEAGRHKTVHVPGERSLTIYLDKRELVTLMTLGSAPEALVLGYFPDELERLTRRWMRKFRHREQRQHAGEKDWRLRYPWEQAPRQSDPG